VPAPNRSRRHVDDHQSRRHRAQPREGVGDRSGRHHLAAPRAQQARGALEHLVVVVDDEQPRPAHRIDGIRDWCVVRHGERLRLDLGEYHTEA
jgi:hypothetical protein